MSKRVGTGSLLIVCVLFLVGCPTSCMVAYRSSAQTNWVTVTQKERAAGRDSSTYLVWVKHRNSGREETMEVSDTLSFLRFDSSDTYGHMQVGTEYQVKVAGWRVPFLSMYRNIIEADATTPEPTP